MYGLLMPLLTLLLQLNLVHQVLAAQFGGFCGTVCAKATLHHLLLPLSNSLIWTENKRKYSGVTFPRELD
jgi:hypothetical protein